MSEGSLKGETASGDCRAEWMKRDEHIIRGGIRKRLHYLSSKEFANVIDDLVQAAHLCAMNYVGQFRSEPGFRKYLIDAGVTTYLKEKRRPQLRVLSSEVSDDNGSQSSAVTDDNESRPAEVTGDNKSQPRPLAEIHENTPLSVHQSDALDDALSQLSDHERDIVVSIEANKQKKQDVAKRYGYSRAWMTKKLRQIRHKLRKLLAESGVEWDQINPDWASYEERQK